MSGEVINNAYEASVARYWDTKRDDAINLLLGEADGLYHHHYGVGAFDEAVLALPPDDREAALLAELHRLESDQTRLILQALGPVGTEDRILDAGSGRGGTAFMLHDRFGCFVDGVSISTYQVDFARELAHRRGCAERVAFHYRNMRRTGFPDGHFDAVVTNETTMYVDLPESFGEFARTVRPGGRYVLITWCINDSKPGASTEAEQIDRHYGCRMHRRSRYLSALASEGFAPYAVTDLTADAIPYWELRSHSANRTGIEAAFLDAYRTDRMNFLLIGAHRLPGTATP